MAPALGFSDKIWSTNVSALGDKSNGKHTTVDAEGLEIDQLKSHNWQLEQQLKESQRRQKELRAQLEEMGIRLSTVEEAEERLCSQLGDLEAEAVEEAQSYNREFNSLQQRLRETENLLLAVRAEHTLQRHR
eukprot:Gb_18061 [translate_table: standard]